MKETQASATPTQPGLWFCREVGEEAMYPVAIFHAADGKTLMIEDAATCDVNPLSEYACAFELEWCKVR